MIDRWNKWVFRLSSGGEYQEEESQKEYSLNTEGSAKKITEEWKTSFEALYEVNGENYTDDGDNISNRQDSKELSAELIKSINEKWSVGFFGG